MIEDQFKGYLTNGTFIFFELDGSKVPYQLVETDDSNHFVILLEGVNNKKKSDRLSGLEIWIPIDTVKSRHLRSPKNIPGKWHEYRIIDDGSDLTFDILRVEEFPQQLMAIITIENKEILIPLSDQLISSIDKENKIIHMRIPDGLLDL
jgi:16S rRNA processing protein RimM